MNDDRQAASQLGRQLMIGALAALSTLGATDAGAAVDIFLKIADIKGESKDDKHKGEIDVLMWSWGLHGTPSPVSNPSTPSKKQPACSLNLIVTKFVDKATPALIQRATLGTTIPLGTLAVRRTGENPEDFLLVDLAGLTVESLSTGASASANALTEVLTFAFASATFKYKPQNPDGSHDAEIVASLPSPCP